MRTTRALILTTMLAVGYPAIAQTTTTDTPKQDKATSQTPTKGNTGSITIGQKTIFKLTPANRLSAEKRAEGARSAILSAITPEPGNTVVKPINLPDDVATKTINGLPVVTLKGKTIVTVTKPDSQANGVSPQVLADRWAQDLRDALASLSIDERTAFQAVRDEIVVARQDTGTQAGTTTANDDQVATSIRNKLKQDANLRNQRIDVNVSEGVVTLRGTVKDRQTEQRAVDTVRKIEGVNEVKSDLRIQGQ